MPKSVDNPHQILKNLPPGTRVEAEYKADTWKVSIYASRFSFPACTATSSDFGVAVAAVLDEMVAATLQRKDILENSYRSLEVMVTWLREYADVEVDLSQIHDHVEHVNTMIEDLDKEEGLGLD